MRTGIVMIGAVASAIAAAPALAAHVNGTVYTDVRGVSNTRDTSSNVWFRNGEFFGGQVGTVAAGPQTPGATEIWASSSTVFAGTSAASFASASLDQGELKTTFTSFALPGLGTFGNARAEMGDSIFFTNTSQSAQSVRLTMSVDGSLGGALVGATIQSRIFLGTSPVGCNDMGSCITPLSDGTGSIQTELLGEFQTGSTPFQFREFLSGDINNDIAHWDLSVGGNHDGIGLFDYTKSIELWVPTGQTTLFLQSEFFLGCNGTALCDFGNTASLRFGALPQGLSFTSQSGAFLTGLGDTDGGNTPGVIPEPASWAMMILGFGLVGAAARRRLPSNAA